MLIGKTQICKDGRPYFIADIAANHDGSLERAYKLIELAKESGADAAKFQNFKAETIVSREGFASLRGKLSHQSSWEKSVYETYEDASISDDWSKLLKEKCNEVGIEYMTSPYDFSSVDIADQYVNAFKIGSGDITWCDILEYIAKKGKPVLLATGASDISDVKRAMKSIIKYNNQIILMQCNTNYTAKRENFKYINLNVLKEYKYLYPDAVLGLSDHTYGYTTVLGAFALGARVFEKHFTDDNDRLGPDHKFSMNPKTWREMVNATYDLYDALGDGNKKVEENEKDTVNIQQRAYYTTKEILKGTVIDKDMIYPVRPVLKNSFLPYEKDLIIGKVASRDMTTDYCIRKEDLL